MFRRRTGELIDSISKNGVLELTMSDLRANTKFDEATVDDIKYSSEPAHRAKMVLLFDGSRVRMLKNRYGSEAINELPEV